MILLGIGFLNPFSSITCLSEGIYIYITSPCEKKERVVFLVSWLIEYKALVLEHVRFAVENKLLCLLSERD